MQNTKEKNATLAEKYVTYNANISHWELHGQRTVAFCLVDIAAKPAKLTTYIHTHIPVSLKIHSKAAGGYTTSS